MACRSSRSASGHGAGGIRSTASCVNVRMIFASRECCSPGITADRDRADPVADDAQEQDHAAVCGSKMLEGVDRDWPRYLASQRFVVYGARFTDLSTRSELGSRSQPPRLRVMQPRDIHYIAFSDARSAAQIG